MYQKLKCRQVNQKGIKLKQFHHVWLDNEFIKDCWVWVWFLSNLDKTVLCCPFVDVNKFVSAQLLNFYSDASKNPDLGMGVIFGNKWMYKQWDKNFIMDQDPSIGYLELYALTAAILQWGRTPELCRNRVVIFCNNQSVIHMINKMSSACNRCMKLIRLLALNGIANNRWVFARYVATKQNDLADS